jgi:hypothetical protein
MADEVKKKFMSPADLAARWLWHPESARRFLRAGRLPSIIIGRRRLVSLDDVIKYEEESTVGGEKFSSKAN